MLPATPGGWEGGGGTPLLVCTAERGMVFKVLSLENRVSLWTGSLTKSAKVGDSN